MIKLYLGQVLVWDFPIWNSKKKSCPGQKCDTINERVKRQNCLITQNRTTMHSYDWFKQSSCRSLGIRYLPVSISTLAAGSMHQIRVLARRCVH